MGLHAIVCMEGGVSNLAVVIKPQGRQGAAWLQTFVYVLGGALGAMIRRTAASLLPYDAEWLTDLATLGYDLWYACPDVSLGCEVVVCGWNDEATGRCRQGLQAGA